MLDIKFIRENPQLVKEGAAKKQVDIDIDEIIALDKERRELLKKVETINALKNEKNKEFKNIISKEKEEVIESEGRSSAESRQKGEAAQQKIIEEMKKVSKENEKNERNLRDVEEKLQLLLRKVPNLPFDEVPVGKSDEENVVLREEGKKKEFNFPVKDYIDIAKNLDIIDLERAAKVSGARFGILKKEAALLQFALINYALQITQKYNFLPVVPPVMIKKEMMQGMGYTERGEEEIYALEKDDLYLVGTSEQIIGPMHAGETFNKKDLPLRYVGYSSCFRREAGSYGKDTRGILRVHQFDKIEMFSFSASEKSKEEHELLLKIEEEIMKGLGIPYRVIDICTGDLGDPAAKKYDIEAWMPGQGEYRETHSTSNCTDFQSRRLNIRYKDQEGSKYVHTLNGTAIPIGRVLIAIIENYQREDGSIEVPTALRKYVGFEEIKSSEK